MCDVEMFSNCTACVAVATGIGADENLVSVRIHTSGISLTEEKIKDI